MKRLLRNWVRMAGIEVTRVGHRPTPRLIDFLESRQVDTVLDVGANIGQFGTTLRQQGYRGRIVSFEPNRSAFAALQECARRDDNWDTHDFALGAEATVMLLKVSRNTVFSSFLDQTEKALQFDPAAKTVAMQPAVVRRLDDVFDSLRCGRTFLKIDTQGFERQVLDGATLSLQRISGVQAELPLVHLYRDVWSLEEAISYMEARRFILSQVRPTNYDRDDWVSMVEVDCVFRQEEAGDRGEDRNAAR